MRTPHRRACLSLAVFLLAGVIVRPSLAQALAAISFRPPITYDLPADGSGAGQAPADWGGVLPPADWDGDGRLDLAVVTPVGLSFFYGNGDGTFAPPVDLPLGPWLHQGIGVDVNGD